MGEILDMIVTVVSSNKLIILIGIYQAYSRFDRR